MRTTVAVALVPVIVMTVWMRVRDGSPPGVEAPVPVVLEPTAPTGPATGQVSLASRGSAGWLHRRVELRVRTDGPRPLAVFAALGLEWSGHTADKTVESGALDGLIPDEVERLELSGPRVGELLDRLGGELEDALGRGARVRHDGEVTIVTHTIETPTGRAVDVWRFGIGPPPR